MCYITIRLCLKTEHVLELEQTGDMEKHTVQKTEDVNCKVKCVLQIVQR